MTTEEIIKGLESVKTECGKHLNEGFAWICKPVDEAIEVLKREPSTDMVSRSKAIEETLKYRMTSGVTNQGTWNECVDTIAQTLADSDALPTVKPKRSKGKWLTPYGSYRYRLTIYRCSLCEYETENNSNYCPKCGAYMREVGE